MVAHPKESGAPLRVSWESLPPSFQSFGIVAETAVAAASEAIVGGLALATWTQDIKGAPGLSGARKPAVLALTELFKDDPDGHRHLAVVPFVLGVCLAVRCASIECAGVRTLSSLKHLTAIIAKSHSRLLSVDVVCYHPSHGERGASQDTPGTLALLATYGNEQHGSFHTEASTEAAGARGTGIGSDGRVVNARIALTQLN
jgi:hypothetical protein